MSTEINLDPYKVPDKFGMILQTSLLIKKNYYIYLVQYSNTNLILIYINIIIIINSNIILNLM